VLSVQALIVTKETLGLTARKR